MISEKAKKFIEKSRVLLIEAEKDFENECYNKTVSASWFALETFIRGILLIYGKPVPERTGALIAKIQKLIKERTTFSLEFLTKLHVIYEKRKRADHREKIFQREEAEKTLTEAKEIYRKLNRLTNI